MTALNTFERFETWISDSWASANQKLAGEYSPFLNDSQPEHEIPEYQQMDFIAEQHCPYFSFSHPEKAIPEY